MYGPVGLTLSSEGRHWVAGAVRESVTRAAAEGVCAVPLNNIAFTFTPAGQADPSGSRPHSFVSMGLGPRRLGPLKGCGTLEHAEVPAAESTDQGARSWSKLEVAHSIPWKSRPRPMCNRTLFDDSITKTIQISL